MTTYKYIVAYRDGGEPSILFGCAFAIGEDGSLRIYGTDKPSESSGRVKWIFAAGTWKTVAIQLFHQDRPPTNVFAQESE